MKIVKLISILFYLQRTLSICASGCLKCDGNNNCLFCDGTQLYVNVDNTCQKQYLEFCIFAPDINQCSVCQIGYYLELNNKCVTNPSGINEIKNCKIYKTFHRCSVCNSQYFLSEDHRECLPVESKIENCEIYLNKNMCQQCNYGRLSLDQKLCEEEMLKEEKCLFVSNRPVCKECKSEYFLNQNYFQESLDNFVLFQKAFSSYHLNLNQYLDLEVCQPISDKANCLQIDYNTNKCTKCNEGFYVDDKDICSQNPSENSKFTVSEIPYCFITIKDPTNQSDTLCKVCYEGYFLEGNRTKCKKHTTKINNCLIMSQTKKNECIKCNDAYYRDNLESAPEEKCHLRAPTNDNCIVPEELSQACKTCKLPQQIKHFQNRYCSNPIDKCDVYETDGEQLSCKYCLKNYYFDQSSNSCVKSQGYDFDPYCNQYDSNKNCTKCFFGYYYDKSNKQCKMNDQEYIFLSQCKTYHFEEKDVCIDCQEDQTLVLVGNTCKLYNDDEAKITQLNQGFQFDKCDQFIMDSDLQVRCTKIRYPTSTKRAQYIAELEKEKLRWQLHINKLPKTSITAMTPEEIQQKRNQYNYLIYLINEELIMQTSLPANPFSKFECEHIVADTANKTVLSESKCDSYYIDTNKESKVQITKNQGLKNMNYCLKFQDEVGLGTSTNKCEVCAPYVYSENQVLIQEDFCSPKGFCQLDDERNMNQGGICVNPLLKCGEFIYKDKRRNTCITEMCTFFQYYQGVQTCTLYGDISTCPMSASYVRNTTYNIYNTDQGICVVDRKYQKETCLETENEKCILCKEGYRPDNFKVYPFIKDVIEPYQNKLNSYPDLMRYCVHFDESDPEIKGCLRCDTGYRINKTSRTCIQCDSDGKVGNHTDLYCLFWSLTTDVSNNKGVCENIYESNEIVNNEKVKYCVKCNINHVIMFTIEKQPTNKLMYYWYNEKREKTFIQEELQEWSTEFCKLKDTKIFFSKQKNQSSYVDCEWGYGDNDQFYCLGCKFGYSGEHELTTSLKHYIEGCTVNTSCDTSVYYFIDDPAFRHLVSCHKCIDQGDFNTYLPTVFFYFFQYQTVFNYSNLVYSKASSTNQNNIDCWKKPFYIDSNCVAQIKIFHEDSLNIWKNKLATMYTQNEFQANRLTLDSTVTELYGCLFCKPMYKPIYWDFKDPDYIEPFFPNKLVLSCVLIQNCKFSRIVNICQECDAGYIINNTNTECFPVENFFKNEDKNNTTTKQALIEKYKYCHTFQTEDYTYTCKTGYIKADKCINYENYVFGCLYFQNDECVQTKAKMGVDQSILSKMTTNEYKVVQNSCVQISTVIANCQFYSEDGKCLHCRVGYKIDKQKTACINYVIENCIREEFVGGLLICLQCADMFKLKKVDERYDSFTISYICEPYNVALGEYASQISRTPGCLKQDEGLCIECVDSENFAPVKITETQTICVDKKFTNLCEEFDLDALYNSKLLQCKTCKKISKIKQDITDKKYSLSYYDFIKPSLARNYIDTNGNIDYQWAINIDMRASLFKLNKMELCRKYKEITNCIKHDDYNLYSSFSCTECLTGVVNGVASYYYLLNGKCSQRQIIDPGCQIYQVKEDACKVQFGQSLYVFNYSTFDLYLINNSPPPFNSNKVQLVEIKNCSSYNSSNICLTCAQGYYLYDNLCMTVNIKISNCSQYITDGVCMQCTSQYILYQNKCLKNYAKNCGGVLTNTSCEFCSTEFPINLSNGHCSKISSIPNCKYYQSTKACYLCEVNYINVKGICQLQGTSIINNCVNQVEGGICEECEKGFALTQDQKACKNEISNERSCSKFDHSQVCMVCKKGYYFFKGQCVLCQTERGCMYCSFQDPTYCEICETGYFMNNFKKCVKEPNFILNTVNVKNVDQINRDKLEIYSQSTLVSQQNSSFHDLFIALAIYSALFQII